MPTATPDEVRDGIRELGSLLAKGEAMLTEIRHEEHKRERVDMPEEEREKLRERLQSLSDIALMDMVLAVHKLIEQNVHGKTYDLARRQAILLTTAFDRFAPVTLADVMALWAEHDSHCLPLVDGSGMRDKKGGTDG